MRFSLFLILCALAFSFSAFTRTSDDDLTWKLAKSRKNQVKSVNYSLFFELRKGSDLFKGKTIITLELNDLKQDLTIDSFLKTIESVKVNGETVTGYPVRKGSFDIPKTKLSRNTSIEVIYSSEYSQDGHGFKKSKDPADGEEYTNTDFEPYYAHWLFPCLDQPDLKATYSVSVNAPKDWLVIHNDLIKDEKVDGEFKTTTFQQTKLFSTYLFFLASGPYTEFKDSFGNLPLFIHARKSMAQYVDEEKMFETIKKGLAFYNEYFAYPYPFSKYGQIFVPDFAAGAMENPGAVSFHERFLFRGPVSSTTMEDRDNIILHEMAHMWFGDLVTMAWWNDLWLNESFATYAATVAQDRGFKSQFAAIDFLNTKSWGHWQDQLVTTHPIETLIPDVRTSKGIFDGITYAKGASALKQLHFYVGEDGFRNGLRDYFKTFAFGNTQRKDFIDSIAKASGKNLDNWTKKWLQTAGPNRVHISYTCKNSKIQNAQIVQNQSVSKTLSPHRVRLGLYKTDEENIIGAGTVDVTYEKSKTQIAELLGKECPDFILPNLEDYDYALFSLDKNSTKLAPQALTKLPEALSRFQVWLILMQMVRDQELAPEKFISMANEALKVEEDETLIGILLGRYSMLRDQYFHYLTVGQRNILAPEFERTLWSRVMKAKPGSSLQLSFFDFYISVAQTKDAMSRILTMIKKNEEPEGIKLDADRRWNLVKALASNGHPEASKIIDTEAKKDNSTMGKRMALASRTALPDIESKRENFNKMIRSEEISYSDFKEAAASFNPINYPEIGKIFVPEFFNHLATYDWHSHDDVVDVYFERLYPINQCDLETEKLSSQKMKAVKNMTSIVRKGWMEAHDELSRCVKVRAKKW